MNAKVLASQIRRPLAAAAACLCLMTSAGCTSFQTVTIASLSATNSVKPGDRVRVTGLDRRTSEFKVTRVTDAGLDGRDTHIALADISQLEVRRFDRRRTWALVGGIGGAILAAAAISAYGQSKLNEEVWNENP